MLGATCPIFQAGAVPWAPGARRGTQGAENRPKIGRILPEAPLPGRNRLPTSKKPWTETRGADSARTPPTDNGPPPLLTFA